MTSFLTKWLKQQSDGDKVVPPSHLVKYDPTSSKHIWAAKGENNTR
jgi:hypothetical protein